MYSGSAPKGYTNNLGVTWATVMLSMGQWCAYSAQGRHKQCTVLLEQPASHSYMYLYRYTSAGTYWAHDGVPVLLVYMYMYMHR